MKRKNVLQLSIGYILILCAMQACSPDMSFESDTKQKIYASSGYLRDFIGGTCVEFRQLGAYQKDSILNRNIHKVAVSIYAQKAGTYKIWTDTVNGFWFIDSGYVEAGTRTIFLKGYGVPKNLRYTIFRAQYNTSYCNFTIPVYL